MLRLNAFGPCEWAFNILYEGPSFFTKRLPPEKFYDLQCHMIVLSREPLLSIEALKGNTPFVCKMD